MKKFLKKISVASLFLLAPVMLTACTGDKNDNPDTPVDPTPVEPVKTEFTITINSTGGTKIDSMTGKPGTAVQAPANPTKQYHTFVGWYADAKCTTPYTFTTIPSEDITVYAKWTAQEASLITFYSNGGSYVAPIYGTEGETITYPANPTKEGCNFEGWYTDLECTTKYTATVYGQSEVVLYAKWSQNSGAYYITYHVGANTYEKYMANSKIVFDESVIPAKNTLAGWYLDEACTKVATEGTTLTSSIDLYASVYTDGLVFDGNKVVGYEGDSTSVIIPTIVNGTVITEIAESAFYGNRAITEVYIPESITSIADKAFYNCEYLVDATLPENLETLGAYAFYNCKRLETIEVLGKVTALNDGVFAGCSVLAQLDLSKVTTIGKYALAGCAKFEALDLKAVTTIAEYALSDMEGLTNLALPQTLISFAATALVGTKVTNITVDNANTNYAVTNLGFVTKDGKTLLRYTGSAAELTFANSGVETIEIAAFEGNATIKKLNVSATTIVFGSLEGMNTLEELTLGNATKFVAYYFGATNAVDNGSSNLYVSDTLNKIVYTTELTTIDDYFFYGITNLSSIEGISNVESIGKYAFAYAAFESFAISAKTTTIYANSFYNCDKIKSYTVADGNAEYKSVNGCIYDKTGATLLMVPAAIGTVDFATTCTTIAPYAFEGTKIETLVIPSTVTTLTKNCLTGALSIRDLTVPFIGDGKDNKYMQYLFGGEMTEKTATDGTKYNTVTNTSNVPASIKSIEITGTITEIPEYAFAFFRNLNEIKYPGTVTKIGNYAYCQIGLKTVEIPATVQEIGEFAFAYNFTLEEVTVYSKTVGMGAFANSFRLKKITFGEGVETIGDNACYAYREADDAGAYHFYSSLEEINIASTVKSIGSDAFFYAGIYGSDTDNVDQEDSLLINFADNSKLETIGDNGFAYSAAKEVYLPASVKSIGSRCFAFCNYLTDVSFGDAKNGSKIESIGPISFALSEKLETVKIYKNVTSSEELPTLEPFSTGGGSAYPFYGCTKATLYVPAASLEFYLANRPYVSSFGTNYIKAL